MLADVVGAIKPTLVQLRAAAKAERDQVALVVAPTLRAGDEVMVLQVVNRAAGGAVCELHVFASRPVAVVCLVDRLPGHAVGLGRALRSSATFTVAIRNVRFTSISLKNSLFSGGDWRRAAAVSEAKLGLCASGGEDRRRKGN